MAWYHLYTDITPPPFTWSSHDFLPILFKSKKTSHQQNVFNSFFSLSGIVQGKEKTLAPRNFFCTLVR